MSGLYNPQSFLTAICQVTAQKNQWELDKLVTWTDVTKKMGIEEMEATSRDGAYIVGLRYFADVDSLILIFFLNSFLSMSFAACKVPAGIATAVCWRDRNPRKCFARCRSSTSEVSLQTR